MPETIATADRVKLTPKEVSKEAKGKIEKDTDPGKGLRESSSIHQKHWDAFIAKHGTEAALLEKLGIEDKRTKEASK